MMRKIYDEVTTGIELVGPEQAKENLAKMRANRNERRRKIEQYALDMGTCAECKEPMDVTVVPNACTRCGGTQSNWRVTDQGVSVDWFDQFLNGGHRMRAVLMSGATVPMLFVRGLDPAARAAMDDGVKRKFADDLSMAGTASATEAAAMLRRVSYWNVAAARNQGHGGLAGMPGFSMSRTAMNAAWPQWEKEITAAIRLSSRYRSGWPGNSGALVFMCWLLTHEGNNPETVHRFLSVMTDGSQNPDDHVLLQCRKLLLGQTSQWRRDNRQAGMEYEVFYMIRAWNAWVRRNKIGKLQLGHGGLADPYPPLIRTR